MKYLIALLLNVFITSTFFAQVQGKIVFNETIKLDIQIEGMDEEMRKMLPESQSMKRELLFDGSESIFQNVKGEELEDVNLSSDDGSFQIKIQRDDTEDILFKNLKEKNQVHQKGLMGKAFVVTNDLPKHKWKLTNEKVKYLEYECQKAVIEDEDKFVVAWFTSQIPTQLGPASYHGLPGTILMLSINDGETEYKATIVDLSPLEKNAIQPPNEGKKVTEAEFEKIRIEKEKEMEEMYGGGQRRRIRH